MDLPALAAIIAYGVVSMLIGWEIGGRYLRDIIIRSGTFDFRGVTYLVKPKEQTREEIEAEIKTRHDAFFDHRNQEYFRRRTE